MSGALLAAFLDPRVRRRRRRGRGGSRRRCCPRGVANAFIAQTTCAPFQFSGPSPAPFPTSKPREDADRRARRSARSRLARGGRPASRLGVGRATSRSRIARGRCRQSDWTRSSRRRTRSRAASWARARAGRSTRPKPPAGWRRPRVSRTGGGVAHEVVETDFDLGGGGGDLPARQNGVEDDGDRLPSRCSSGWSRRRRTSTARSGARTRMRTSNVCVDSRDNEFVISNPKSGTWSCNKTCGSATS